MPKIEHLHGKMLGGAPSVCIKFRERKENINNHKWVLILECIKVMKEVEEKTIIRAS